MANDPGDTTNNSIYASFQQSFISRLPRIDPFAERLDALSDEAIAKCRNGCKETWETNWYKQQVDALNTKWNKCESDAQAEYDRATTTCNSYSDPMMRGMCFLQAYERAEYQKTYCVVYEAIKPNEGLTTPVNYAALERLSWYDGKTRCIYFISLNAAAKANACISKNCR